MKPESTIDGFILNPDSPGYDAARSVWNRMVDHKPALIARCSSTADVVTAAHLARARNLEVGVRCGGHNVTGLSVPHNGLMIDLTPMNAVEIDPVKKMARVEGGAMLGALDHASQRFGLATTAGNVSHTGVGGLTLGGGMGWLARQHGLACDNVESFEVVTAEGKVLHISADDHPELFWGLRGGGGNFGIVVEFEFRLHQVGTQALVAEVSFPIDRANEPFRNWRNLAAQAPRPATFTATISGGNVSLGYVWVGEPNGGRSLLPDLRSIGTPLSGRVDELSYLELQTREDDVEGHSFRRYWKGHYLPALDDMAIETLLHREPYDALEPAVSIQAYGGAIADVEDDATAFSHRGAKFEYVAAARWSDPSEDIVRMNSARETAAKMDRFARGAYVNALSDEGRQGVRRAYPEAQLARLTDIKDAYDPDNVFHLNHNIVPSGH